MVVFGTGASNGIGIGKAAVVRDIKPEVIKTFVSDVVAE